MVEAKDLRFVNLIATAAIGKVRWRNTRRGGNLENQHVRTFTINSERHVATGIVSRIVGLDHGERPHDATVVEDSGVVTSMV